MSEKDSYDVGGSAGVKFDKDKPRMTLVPFDVVYKSAEVYNYGAKKYEDHNWAKGMRHCRVADAALRHLTAWLNGEDKDAESGLDHLAHFNCCAQMLYAMQLRGVGTDDRFKIVKQEKESQQ